MTPSDRPVRDEAGPGGGPSTGVDIAARVAARWPKEIQAFHRTIDYIVATGDQQRFTNTAPLRGSSILLPYHMVHSAFIYADATHRGSFDHEGPVVLIQALAVGIVPEPRKYVSLPPEEAEGWARAILGAERAEHAYRMVPVPESKLSFSFFPVFVDRAGRCRPCPPDFDWSEVAILRGRGAGPVEVEPLREGVS